MLLSKQLKWYDKPSCVELLGKQLKMVWLTLYRVVQQATKNGVTNPVIESLGKQLKWRDKPSYIESLSKQLTMAWQTVLKMTNLSFSLRCRILGRQDWRRRFQTLASCWQRLRSQDPIFNKNGNWEQKLKQVMRGHNIDRQTDRQMDQRTDRWTDRPTDTA